MRMNFNPGGGRERRLSISARVSEQVKTIISTLLNTECVESDPRPRRKYHCRSATVRYSRPVTPRLTIALDLNREESPIARALRARQNDYCT